MDLGPFGWIVLGFLGGALSGAVVGGRTARGCLPNVVVGILGALVGGWLAAVLFNSHPIDGPLDISSIVVATIGAIIVVVVVGMFTGRRTGRGTI